MRERGPDTHEGEGPDSWPLVGFFSAPEAEHVAIEAQRHVEITQTQNEVIQAADTDGRAHGAR